MKLQTNERGISLIVLVITIIVMIILAGVIIISLTNSDIITKSKEAKESSDFSAIKEMVEIEVTNSMFPGETFDVSNIQIPSSYINDIQVTSQGTILIKYNVDTKITDISNALEKLDAVYIPKGFELSTVATEQSKEDGLVIIDSTLQNEFVWVPVPDITQFYRINNFSTFTPKPVGGEWDNTSYDLSNSTDGTEYDAMIDSVTKYKGFYVARYEAGISDIAQKNITDGSVKPLSKPNFEVWEGNNMNQTPSITVARAMYPVVSAVTVGSPVSTLMYGEEWDATMRYMRSVPNIVDTTKKYIVDSTGMGNYGALISNTGTNSAYAVKNIYDMAGNAYEITMEYIQMVGYSVRGGAADDEGGQRSASSFDASYYYGTGSGTRSYCSFRVALYIK